MISYLESAEHVSDLHRDCEFILAKDQKQYAPLAVLAFDGAEGSMLTRWKLTAEQRQAIAAGADVFLEVWTFGRPFLPVRIAVSDDPSGVVDGVPVDDLFRSLRLARTRLEICLGRFEGCEGSHPVSVAELPAWIEEIDAVIGPRPRPGSPTALREASDAKSPPASRSWSLPDPCA